ncbi:HMG box protein [Phlyctema vagabunda]|uniref:HMG box protein n=1 Tax=Phlyctema vagabunda TaxID=108571 RepID=A0ABR4PX53_9HELO
MNSDLNSRVPREASPPQRQGDEYHDGLQQLALHNAHTPYPQDHYDDGFYHPATYGSPTPDYDQSAFGGFTPGYGDSVYNNSGYQSRTYTNTPATSPPTPKHTIRTRSGIEYKSSQGLKRSPAPTAGSRAPAPSRAKKSRKDKVKTESRVQLTAPLSIITAKWDHVPVVDIEAYVNRPAEERQREIQEGKNPGKVKRPMNSFMLYRKAYQMRTKEYCLQNNHQIVSQVCGESWPMEPDHVRAQYTNWARIESENHFAAHPGYKFTPSKPGAPNNREIKRKRSVEVEEESDLDDYDYQEGRTRKKQKATPVPQRQQQPTTAIYPTTESAYNYGRGNSVEPSPAPYGRSHYLTSNPGKQFPMQYDQEALQPGQYYQQETINHSDGQIQDVIMRKTGMSHVGLPGGNQYDFLSPPPADYSQYASMPMVDNQIDPALMGPDQTLFDGNYGTPEPPYFPDHQPGESLAIDPSTNFGGDGLLDDFGIQDQHMHMLRGHQEGWEINTLDAGQEFDKWMEETI